MSSSSPSKGKDHGSSPYHRFCGDLECGASNGNCSDDDEDMFDIPPKKAPLERLKKWRARLDSCYSLSISRFVFSFWSICPIQKPASPSLLPAPAPPPPFTLVTMPLPKQSSDVERQAANTNIHNSRRAQRLRLAVRGANEGLVSTALLMMGIGDLKKEKTAMILYVFTGLVAGAINISIREFVSVYHDIEVAQMNSPMQMAAVSAHAFFIGGMIPLLTAAFMKTHKVVGVVISVTLALMLFGGLRAKLGRKPIGRCCLMVMVEGWFAMLMNFGLMKLFQSLSLG
ncbi:vacuolar iron transporter homolog 2-like [Magnolia sinica]|uniref:vacuolar iron transporter homolog 2-like n=1 Tax=Magnolia sinica TaxID=86752 RepID=UPI0026588481|nr:vacuolar iron transporter homolog 2-like [Magnolia sinica]